LGVHQTRSTPQVPPDEIDRLINRTLVYGTFTAAPGLVYADAVLVLGEPVPGIAGNPPSWVAGATLAVTALFQRQPGTASNNRSTDASTAASTAPPRPSRHSALAGGRPQGRP
jgi:hypothetical protein